METFFSAPSGTGTDNISARLPLVFPTYFVYLWSSGRIAVWCRSKTGQSLRTSASSDAAKFVSPPALEPESQFSSHFPSLVVGLRSGYKHPWVSRALLELLVLLLSSSSLFIFISMENLAFEGPNVLENPPNLCVDPPKKIKNVILYLII